MKLRILFFLGFLIFFIVSDFYTYKALLRIFPKWDGEKRFIWIYSLLKLALWGSLVWILAKKTSPGLRQFFLTSFLALYAAQFFVLIFAWIDEIRRAGVFILSFFRPVNQNETEGIATHWDTIPRSEFLTKTGLTLGSLAFLGITSISGKALYDYRVRKVDLVFPNLPSEFEGIKIVQLSDIHSGSFFNEKAVSGGVDLLLGLKADLIFFTGDLVNNRADEMKDYQKIFSRLKAPLGVFSILGNHDYGDYQRWSSEKDKSDNLKSLIQVHRNMGYSILLNENKTIQIGNQKISVIGVENWSALSQFPKHGRLDLAVKGTEESPIKLLLSHDPSHWKAQIIPDYRQIDMTFSGHTHGMQMGIRLPHFQWSPVQYVYPEWAGLYREGNQQIYVNVGFGFLGYPGRIGMYPEITLFTLSKNAKKG